MKKKRGSEKDFIMSDSDDSAYRVLIDNKSFQRSNRTKELLQPKSNKSTALFEQLLFPSTQQEVPVTEDNDPKPTEEQKEEEKPKLEIEKKNYDFFGSVANESPPARARQSFSPANQPFFNAAKYTNSSDSDSSSDSVVAQTRKRRLPPKSASPKKGLSNEQRQAVMSIVKQHCPQEMYNVVLEDVFSQMEHLEKQGYNLPPNYDKQKNDLSTNEIRLYEQQVQRDKDRDKKKMSYMINFAAMGLNGFCQCMNFDWIKTKQLPRIIRKSIKDGDFDDCLDGVGSYLRGTIFDHPVFSTVLKFVEKVSEAHQLEVEEENIKLQEEQERRAERNNAAMNSLNSMRGTKVNTGLQQYQPSTKPAFALPPPPSTQNESEQKKKTLR